MKLPLTTFLIAFTLFLACQIQTIDTPEARQQMANMVRLAILQQDAAMAAALAIPAEEVEDLVYAIENLGAPQAQVMNNNVLPQPKRHDTMQKRWDNCCMFQRKLLCSGDCQQHCCCLIQCPISTCACLPCIAGYVCHNSKTAKKCLYGNMNELEDFKDDEQ